MTESKKIDFATILMSATHDMKNSLSMIMLMLEEVSDQYLADHGKPPAQLSTIQYETRRLNNDLMQLLGLYKMGRNEYQPLIDNHCVRDLLDDIITHNRSLAEQQGVSTEIRCDRNIIWFFDRGLILSVLNTIMNNALRYGKSRILISAKTENDQLLISIDDDGSGYPEHMLKEQTGAIGESDYESGSTGLGLFFAQQAAEVHQNKGVHGHTLLTNGGALTGACFSIYLP